VGGGPGLSASPAGSSFEVSGNKIIGPIGQRFVPYGFVLFCLATTTLACEHQSPTDSQKMEAAATYWHANTVRLQVAQEHLFDRSPYDATYLAAIDQEVALAHSLGLAVILSLQEEEFGGPTLPTASATRFWAFMAAHFRDSAVIFDLYNEPRLAPYDGFAWEWNIWRNGGHVDTHGIDETFVGMQSLLKTIRTIGAHNVVEAEGLGKDHDLSEVSTHYLTGANVVYGIEPDLNADLDTPAEWAKEYGDLADSVPVVMDAFQDYPTSGACFSHSPSVLPEEMNYLASKQLGLLVWTMAPGVTMVSIHLTDPTDYTGATQQRCVAHNESHQPVGPGYNAQTNTNGPGADILAYFEANSRQIPAYDLGATV
jgi:hypothetical protein